MSKALDFIFNQTSKRIGHKIREVGRPYQDIFMSDPKILSCIVNQQCTKNNIFLVPDRALIDFKNKDGLIPKVFFPQVNSNFKISDDKLRTYKCEILWGTEEERKKYAKGLFIAIMRDLYDSKENKEYENIFCAYIPFAKNYTYKQITELNPNIPLTNYGIIIINPPEQYLGSAARFLYQEIKTQYENAFLEFTMNKDTFKNIERDFSRIFVQGKLVPILKEYVEREHPLGLRVRELIQGELSRVPTMLDGTMDEQQMEYYYALNRATTNYFLALEDIQVKKHQG